MMEELRLFIKELNDYLPAESKEKTHEETGNREKSVDDTEGGMSSPDWEIFEDDTEGSISSSEEQQETNLIDLEGN
jgi:hypothetical protein